MDNEHAQAVQAVVDRLTSYQGSATDSTVEKELREALTETDVELTDEQVTALADAIEKSEDSGPVDAREVLA